MTLARTLGGNLRGIVFDLDRTLIDSRRAWCYAIEESLLATRGERIDARHLAEEYQHRPWRDAISIVEPERQHQDRCVRLCEAMYARSAMKRLLVFDGIGMMLDELRSARIEVGAISRLPHQLARKQIESTGLERFVTVLESVCDDEPWDAPELVARCSSFLETAALCYVGTAEDVESVAALGMPSYIATWPGSSPGHVREALSTPRALITVLGG
ncbi:MAG: HAD family hydrolase [Dehalococcoidia bacterium]|nr:HAD family hydrolase [Dehalococcoidia bacterium]MCA9855277.1 HAD family hydrolase [Dehalococcoidia bacterium]